MPEQTSVAKDAASAVAAILAGVPDDQLKAALKEIEKPIEESKVRLKKLGNDPAVEAMLKDARQDWLGSESTVSNDVMRTILASITLTKGKTSFNEELSDVERNESGADFDVTFQVGSSSSEGFVTGEATNTDCYSYNGRIESSFFMIEDDLTNHMDWTDEEVGFIKKDAESWREACGLNDSDASWQDVAKIVAAGVCHLVDDCEYNEDEWVWEYLTDRLKEELARLPAAAEGNEGRQQKRQRAA